LPRLPYLTQNRGLPVTRMQTPRFRLKPVHELTMLSRVGKSAGTLAEYQTRSSPMARTYVSRSTGAKGLLLLVERGRRGTAGGTVGDPQHANTNAQNSENTEVMVRYREASVGSKGIQYSRRIMFEAWKAERSLRRSARVSHHPRDDRKVPVIQCSTGDLSTFDSKRSGLILATPTRSPTSRNACCPLVLPLDLHMHYITITD
jgi:hypothetical protein